MTIHFTFTVPAILMLSMVLLSLLLHKRLPIRLHRSFFWLLIIDLITMGTDYAASWTGTNHAVVPMYAVYLANIAFFMFFILRSCWFTVITIDLMEDGHRITERERHLAMIVCLSMEAFMIVCGLFNGIFYFDANGYHTGPLYPFIDLQFLFWILFAVFMTVRSGYQNRRPSFAHEAILLVGVILHMLSSEDGVMNTYCLAAILIIYIFEVDPGRFTDPASGLINREGWRRILQDRNGLKNTWFVGFEILDFESKFRSIHNDLQRKNILYEIGSWMVKTYPDCNCCYLGKGRFMIDSEKPFDTEKAVEQLRTRFLGTWDTEQTSCYFHISIIQQGRDYIANDSDLITGTIKNAFDSLYREKKQMTLVLHEDILTNLKKRIEVGRYLTDALANHSLIMYLQPVITSGDGPLAGAEALARLQGPDGSIIYPDTFIPVAREKGLLPEIGRQMMENACRFLSRPEVKKSSLKCVNVNVAPEQMLNPNLLEEFLDIIHRYGISPERIQLEITEESSIDTVLLHDQMEKFVEAGFHFALDDYGAANGSYMRLSRNRFSTLKLDKDLVWTWSKSPDRYIPDLVNMVHEKNMMVVAEGVENKEMLKQISDAGCDCIQGYYYSKPIPQDAFTAKYILNVEA